MIYSPIGFCCKVIENLEDIASYGIGIGSGRVLFVPAKEPMDAEFVGEMPIGAKWHFSQVIQKRFVRTRGELVEDSSEFTISSAVDVHANRIALLRFSGGVHPVRR